MQKKYQQLPGLRGIAFIALCVFLLAGCAAKRDLYNVPTVPLPDRYSKTPTVADVTHTRNNMAAAVVSDHIMGCGIRRKNFSC